MVYILLIGLLLAAAFAPSLWAKWVLSRNNTDRPDFPGTGGELAEHLVERHNLTGVVVEETDQGSHYDPIAKAVRLEPDYYHGRSVSAVAVAAHEVGHAIQDHENYPPLRTRHALVMNTTWVPHVARVAMFAAPIAGIATRAPGLALACVAAGAAAMAVNVLIHAVTLPVELDASYKRALPVLDQGGYLAREDMPAATSVLRACALTYVAGALTSMFNLWTWIRALR